MRKFVKIIVQTIPILIMIGLIPFVMNDYLLTLIFIGIIVVAFSLKRERHDYLIFLVGFLGMVVSEYLFVSTGVETFLRHSLFGLMPLWLPFLWGYGFVVMKRAVGILS